MKVLYWIGLVLLVIGGLNWGLVGLFNFNLIDLIFSGFLARLIYIIMGLAAVFMIYMKCCRKCRCKTS